MLAIQAWTGAGLLEQLLFASIPWFAGVCSAGELSTDCSVKYGQYQVLWRV
jgi:hypothetical protein